MKTKKILFFALCIVFFNSAYFETKAQTTIPPGFFGLNGWMPDYIGTSASPGPTLAIPQSTNPAGKLYNFSITATSTLGITSMRYGGKNQDVNYPTVSQYTTFVNMCNSTVNVHPITPIIQLPFSHEWYLQAYPNATVAANTASYQTAISNLVTTLSASPYNVNIIVSVTSRMHIRTPSVFPHLILLPQLLCYLILKHFLMW